MDHPFILPWATSGHGGIWGTTGCVFWQHSFNSLLSSGTVQWFSACSEEAFVSDQWLSAVNSDSYSWPCVWDCDRCFTCKLHSWLKVPWLRPLFFICHRYGRACRSASLAVGGQWIFVAWMLPSTCYNVLKMLYLLCFTAWKGSERLSDLFQIAQCVKGRTGIQRHVWLRIPVS